MQTFLPYPSFIKSAQALDRQRLGKQRVEVLQILRVLTGYTMAWNSHPAIKMWTGYINELVLYGTIICDEWIRRGYQDTCRDKIIKFRELDKLTVAPPWRGDEAFHSSHRAALLAKNYEWYSQFGWIEQPQINYIWPTKGK